MSLIIEKVTVFVTRPSTTSHDLLLFRHPNAGIQIPAGTVEVGEAPEAAALREAREETGLKDLGPPRFLGSTEETLPDNQRVVCGEARVYARPDRSSFDWAMLRRGIAVERVRREDGFSQVTYKEYDNLENPQYVTYQITGWVEDKHLADTCRRYFYRILYQGSRSAPWRVETGNHRFRLFWAPLNALPEIVPPQNSWLPVLFQDGPLTSKT